MIAVVLVLGVLMIEAGLAFLLGALLVAILAGFGVGAPYLPTVGAILLLLLVTTKVRVRT